MTEQQINDLRRRIDAGEQVTNEEIMAGLDAIRSARLNASIAAPAKGAKAVSMTPMTIDLKSLISKVHEKRESTVSPAPAPAPAITPPAIEAPKT